MMKTRVDVAVIGGGPAGLVAAVSAQKHGAENVVVIDRNSWLGGILPQCIHDGFGVEETGESMTGPEYAERYIMLAKQQGVQLMKETMVLSFDENLQILAVNKHGLLQVKAKSIVLATGCREKTRWSVMIPGKRPSGIYTAGVAQAFINLYNHMPGKKVVILGSGDVGLIMARRLKLEGAEIAAVVEILPYPSGLPRNVVQCLDDYGIPLFLNHTVTYIDGQERLKSVTIAQVDGNNVPVPESERQIKCDTLLLSLGLIPENELSKSAGVEIDILTGGPAVNQHLETSIHGIFACGNSLQVYDTVDVLSVDASRAGKNAAEHAMSHKQYLIQSREENSVCQITPGKGVRYVVPQRITAHGKLPLTIRAENPQESPILRVTADTQARALFKKKLPWANPANIIKVDITVPHELPFPHTLEVTIVDE
jgi:NADPH-dependent 2,4-dienoyl-CoA reductase/sulfur reductase-like enzyme